MNLKPAIVLAEIGQDKKVNIKIRLSHQRKTRYIPTKFRIYPNEFDSIEGKVNENNLNYRLINIEIKKIVLDYEEKLIKVDINRSITWILNYLKNAGTGDPDFFEFVNKQIDNLRITKNDGQADLYYYTLVALKKFTKSDELLFKFINHKFLVDFELFEKVLGNKTNTISIYLRNIRTAFKLAIDAELISDELYPFRRFKIKSDKNTPKRNLQITQVKKLKNAILTDKEAYARDMFLFSFYLIGMNFKDIYNADTINNGRLIYKRAKGGRIYSIKLLPQATAIIKKYAGKDKILNCSEIYNTVYNFRKAVNKFLKRIAEDMELGSIPTGYYARHSWATIASSLKIDKDTISHALGHEIGSQTTTIYIDFNMNDVDTANALVCKAINS